MTETGLNIRGFSYLSYSIDCVVNWVSGLISSGFNNAFKELIFFPEVGSCLSCQLESLSQGIARQLQTIPVVFPLPYLERRDAFRS